MVVSSASRPTKGSSTKLLSSGDAGVGATSECSSLLLEIRRRR